jgi:hypothetical protein
MTLDQEGAVACGRRLRRTALCAVAIAAAAAGCGTTVPMDEGATPTPSTSTSASVPAATLAAERNADAQLQSWLWDPQGGTMTYNTIQVTSGGAINVMTILNGPFDPSGAAALTGSIETLGSGSTTPGTATAIETNAQVFTTIPTGLQTGSREGKQWQASRVDATWEGNAVHSGWWQALYQTRDLKAEGATSLGGTSVEVYTQLIDLSKLSDIPKALLDSQALRKAGTTEVEVDVYTVAGSGKLARVTYKLGLPVAIDASATATATAGYEVDLSGFAAATATPLPTPVPSATEPAPTTVASGTGDQDLAAMLLF